ncbi:MAG: hypothetical protein AAFY76_08230 [Cyanobacteria bacterium J06649_11]
MDVVSLINDYNNSLKEGKYLYEILGLQPFNLPVFIVHFPDKHIITQKRIHSTKPANLFDYDLELQERLYDLFGLISNLKRFLTEAKLNFLFTGDRSYYKASLSDIADRESFFSSIFNQVIYLPNESDDSDNQNLAFFRTATALKRYLFENRGFLLNHRLNQIIKRYQRVDSLFKGGEIDPSISYNSKERLIDELEFYLDKLKTNNIEAISVPLKIEVNINSTSSDNNEISLEELGVFERIVESAFEREVDISIV